MDFSAPIASFPRRVRRGARPNENERCSDRRPTMPTSSPTQSEDSSRGYLRRGSTGAVELGNEVHLAGVNCVATVRICSLMSFWRNPWANAASWRSIEAGCCVFNCGAPSLWSPGRACGARRNPGAWGLRQKRGEWRDCLREGYARPEAARRERGSTVAATRENPRHRSHLSPAARISKIR